ncbi:hypothetical protein Hanom_Chr04g00344261 [Helianthus anomalus]
MMFQALGCCTLLYMFSKHLHVYCPTTASFFTREREREGAINPSSTLQPLRRRAAVTVTVNASIPTVATARRDLRV